MIGGFSKLWLPSMLLVVALMLGWVVYRQLASKTNLESFASSTPGVSTALPELTPELGFTVAALEDYQVVLDRPLFSPSRLPAVEETASLGAPQDFDYVLKGVVIDDRARLALLKNKSDGQTVRFTEGSEIDGWLIKEVEPEFVVVERDGTEHILELEYDPQPLPNNRSSKVTGN